MVSVIGRKWGGHVRYNSILLIIGGEEYIMSFQRWMAKGNESRDAAINGGRENQGKIGFSLNFFVVVVILVHVITGIVGGG